MSTLFPKTIVVRRPTGSYVAGIWTETTTSSTFEGSVQPITGKELEALQIGRKDIGKVKIYSSSELNVSLEGKANTGDVVEAHGSLWEIISRLPYQNDLIPHYKYIGEHRGQLA